MATHATTLFLLLLALSFFTPLLAFSDKHTTSLRGSSIALEINERNLVADVNGGQKVWCVGKPAAEDMYLRRNIDYACGEGGVDCKVIQQGGSCFLPNSPIAHASLVMNLYYQKNGRNWWNCHFNNTGLVVFTDPSFGNCKYTAQWTT